MLDGKYKQRFSQLLLDDQEVYINKFLVLLKENKQGLCHVTSRSVILEPFNSESPVTQYYYRDMCNVPRLDPDFSGSLIFSICSYKVLPDVFHHSSTQFKTDPIHEISFQPLHESPKTVVETILIYYIKGKNNNWTINSKEIIESIKAKNKFDYNQIFSIREQYVTREAVFCFQVMPLEMSQGWMMITDQRVYFQHIFPVSKSQLLTLDCGKILNINKRKLIFQNVAVEIFIEKKSFLFRFLNEKSRDFVFVALAKALPEISKNEEKLDEMMAKWQQRQISNYEYLLYLNQMANRSFNDFSQYPVFPWVLSNYKSNVLDLNDSRNYRDLSKPIGLLNLKRLAYLKSQSFDESKLLYMSHYSFPAMITRWLIRKFPIFTWNQQKGKFPHPSKIFHDIQEDWQSCLTTPNDFRELIPEFYSNDSSFLLNSKHLDLGLRPDRESVSDVKLPIWAKSADDFLQQMRKALESEFVSQNLHSWIDLIFGKNQRGEMAVECNNGKNYSVFHPMSYEGFFDFDSATDQEVKEKNHRMVQEYGQVPKQLFKFGHPPRSEIPSVLEVKRLEVCFWDDELILKRPAGLVTELPGHSQRVTSLFKLDSKLVSTGNDGVILVSDSKKVHLDRPISNSALQSSSHFYCTINENVVLCNLALGQVVQEFTLHDDRISSIQVMEPNLLVTSSWDQKIKVWDNRTLLKPVFSYSNDREFTSLDLSLNNTCSLFAGDMSGTFKSFDIRLGLVDSVKCSDYIFNIKSTLLGEVVCGSLATQVFKNSSLISSFNLPGVQSVASDGRFAFFGKEEENLQMWELVNQNFLYVWDEVCDVSAVMSDGLEVYAGTIQGSIIKID